jgi:hypothetical protein
MSKSLYTLLVAAMLLNTVRRTAIDFRLDAAKNVSLSAC